MKERCVDRTDWPRPKATQGMSRQRGLRAIFSPVRSDRVVETGAGIDDCAACTGLSGS